MKQYTNPGGILLNLTDLTLGPEVKCYKFINKKEHNY